MARLPHGAGLYIEVFLVHMRQADRLGICRRLTQMSVTHSCTSKPLCIRTVCTYIHHIHHIHHIYGGLGRLCPGPTVSISGQPFDVGDALATPALTATHRLLLSTGHGQISACCSQQHLISLRRFSATVCCLLLCAPLSSDGIHSSRRLWRPLTGSAVPVVPGPRWII